MLGFGYATWMNYQHAEYLRERWGYACLYGDDLRLVLFVVVGARRATDAEDDEAQAISRAAQHAQVQEGVERPRLHADDHRLAAPAHQAAPASRKTSPQTRSRKTGRRPSPRSGRAMGKRYSTLAVTARLPRCAPSR